MIPESRNRLLVRKYRKRESKAKDVHRWPSSRTSQQKRDYDNNNEVERKLASIDATLEPSEKKGKTSEIIAKKIGVSTTMGNERGKKIIEKGTETKKTVSEKIL